MVIKSVVAKRYCDALFAAALEANALDQVKNDLEKLLAKAKSNIRLYKFITSRVLPKAEKQQVWGKIVDDKTNQLVRNFINLLIRYNRLDAFELIVEMYNNHYKKHKGIKSVTVFSPLALSAEQKKEVANELETIFGRGVEVQGEVDPSLLGGMVIKIESKMLDLSIKNRLSKVKRHISNLRV